MATFKLEIELGNDAMQTPRDVAEVMREWIRRNTGQGTGDQFNFFKTDVGPKVVRDANGNNVGSWEVVP